MSATFPHLLGAPKRDTRDNARPKGAADLSDQRPSQKLIAKHSAALGPERPV